MISLLGPPGFPAFLHRLATACGSQVLDPGFELEVFELAPGRVWRDASTGFEIRGAPTPHTAESIACRVRVGGAVVGYTGDTGPSPEVASFLSGCDVLVAECTQPDPPALDTHLSPMRLAELAGSARPELLVVTHVSPPRTPEDAAGEIARRHDGRVVAGRDGLVIPLR